jgi:hypothetical protein
MLKITGGVNSSCWAIKLILASTGAPQPSQEIRTFWPRRTRQLALRHKEPDIDIGGRQDRQHRRRGGNIFAFTEIYVLHRTIGLGRDRALRQCVGGGGERRLPFVRSVPEAGRSARPIADSWSMPGRARWSAGFIAR